MLHLEQLNSQISLFLYWVSSRTPRLCHTPRSCPPLKESRVVTPASPGSSSPRTLEFHLRQAENSASWAACSLHFPTLKRPCHGLLHRNWMLLNKRKFHSAPSVWITVFLFWSGLFPVIPVESTFPFCLKILQFRFQISNQVVSTMTCSICETDKPKSKIQQPSCFCFLWKLLTPV